MHTFVLNSEIVGPVEELVKHAGDGGVEVRDAGGNVVAYVLTPHDREAWMYAEANLEVSQYRDQLLAASRRSGGVTTKQLFEKLGVPWPPRETSQE